VRAGRQATDQPDQSVAPHRAKALLSPSHLRRLRTDLPAAAA
jgi:hypothetical protein